MSGRGDEDDLERGPVVDGSAVLTPEAVASIAAAANLTHVLMPVPGSVTGAMTALYSDGTVVRRWRAGRNEHP
ncbi:hypothetical protein [Desertivibrio insolitus]|uniref:hypothetical protein n=1 Tax=Herbiconiux sp. SYSU D00978 TaxID=2812562 RepID=UPI001A977483|nr:hypothetical protein [Herbiconiux sp. SYSU D00978]